jgi:hypothetical protein
MLVLLMKKTNTTRKRKEILMLSKKPNTKENQTRIKIPKYY